MPYHMHYECQSLKILLKMLLENTLITYGIILNRPIQTVNGENSPLTRGLRGVELGKVPNQGLIR